MIEDVGLSDQIYSMSTAYFLQIRVQLLKFGMIGICLFLMFLLVNGNLILIYFIIVRPIKQLTQQINNPHRNKDFDLGIKNLTVRAYNKKEMLKYLNYKVDFHTKDQTYCSSCKRKFFKYQRDRLKYRVDEVEQLRLLYS